MSEDEFEPHLGRMRSGGGKRGRKYASRIIAAASKAGGASGGRNRRFDGSRIGRGASMGRLLGSRDRLGAFRGRRAVVKTRLVRLGAKGMPAARAHLRYIQRDGVTREGEPGALYSTGHDQADGKAFLERCDGDRHQFRFIVSAEDGADYPDLKPFVRRLMAQVEEDLGTKLDWVAVDHFNTSHPHTHIMLRGVDDQRRNLVIAREYIAHGLRARAAELVTLDLGPRTTQEIEARLRHDIGEERLTAIDRRLIKAMDADRIVAASDRDPFQQSLRAGRLQMLGKLGLAEPVGQGCWRLADHLEERLRRLGERGDVIRTLQRDLSARKLDRPIGQVAALDPGQPPLIGRVVQRGFADEHQDRHYLIIDGVDGEAHYVAIGRGDAVEPLPEGALVRVTPRSAAVRQVDRTVAEVAAAHGGRYSVDLHLRHDPRASQDFAEAHVRRLEAMRKVMSSVERLPDGSWAIAADHLDRAAALEAHQNRDRPVDVEALASGPLERLHHVEAATWLDDELAGGSTTPVRDAGLGREIRTALSARRQWLVEQGLAGADGSVSRDALDTLRRRELRRVAAALADDLGKPFAEATIGEAVHGRLARRMDLVSGRFALIERSRDFTLVPWRPILEARVGQQVAGIMRTDGISWRLSRGRSGPEIG